MSNIDPRLRQRRIAVRRAQGRRRLRVLIAAVVFVSLAGGAYALSRSSAFDLDTVMVDGALGADAEAVAAASGLEIGTPMLDLDIDAAEAAVTELAWVETASVERAWPGTVEIMVSRRIGVALLPTGDGDAVVIDDEGVAIARSATSAVGTLPVITLGPSGDLGDVQTLALPALTLIDAMPVDLVPWVETYGIAYGGAGTPSLTLDLIGDAVAELGDDRQLSAKLDTVRSVLAQVDLACVAVIDARLGGDSGVIRDDECEAAGTTEATSE